MTEYEMKFPFGASRAPDTVFAGTSVLYRVPITPRRHAFISTFIPIVDDKMYLLRDTPDSTLECYLRIKSVKLFFTGFDYMIALGEKFLKQVNMLLGPIT